VWFYTFTEPGRKADESYWTKTQAEVCLKPFLDRLRSRKAEFLVFWEKQSRGSWHPHVLLNVRYQVDELRAFMMARGWGQQMKLRYVVADPSSVRHRDFQVLKSYLVKSLMRYLTKACTDDAVEPRKKFFGGSAGAKVGTVRFAWLPEFEPGTFLYYWGKQLWIDLHGCWPKFGDMALVVRMGVEVTGWLEIDPWWTPRFT
jgi:hypothetical protein